MVSVRVPLGRRVAAALLRYDVQQHGHAHIPRPGEGADKRAHVVAVHGAEIVEAEVVEDVRGQYRALYLLLHGVYGVVYGLHPAHRAAVAALELEVGRAHAHPAQELRHAADVAAYAHRVVVEYDDHGLAALPGVGEALICKAAGERAVADKGGHVVVLAQLGARAGHAERDGDAVGGVAGDKGVRLALGGLREAGDAARMPQPVKAGHAAREQLMRIALVADVED